MMEMIGDITASLFFGLFKIQFCICFRFLGGVVASSGGAVASSGRRCSSARLRAAAAAVAGWIGGCGEKIGLF